MDQSDRIHRAPRGTANSAATRHRKHRRPQHSVRSRTPASQERWWTRHHVRRARTQLAAQWIFECVHAVSRERLPRSRIAPRSAYAMRWVDGAGGGGDARNSKGCLGDRDPWSVSDRRSSLLARLGPRPGSSSGESQSCNRVGQPCSTAALGESLLRLRGPEPNSGMR